MKDILEALESLNEALLRENKEREKNSSLPIGKARICVLGQMCLLLNEHVSQRMNLFATQDVDAIVHGDWVVTDVFRRLLRERGLEFDFLSSEIWLPEGAKYIPIYDSELVVCEILDPISALISKAVKAPEKNRILIGEALDVFGAPLATQLEKHGKDPAEFKKKQKFKL